MAKRGWWGIPGLVVLAALGLGGCAGSGGGSDGGLGGVGGDNAGGGATAKRLRILVTDAPFSFGNVKSATVEVQRVDLHRAGAGEGAFDTLATFAPAREIDLVQLQNGAMELLVEGDPAPGDYDQIRIVVLPKRIVIDDNGVEKEFPFKVPSGPQTGIKVFVAPVVSVVTHLTSELVLDFDLSRSFVVQGNPSTPAGIKGFHFKPVVRAINRSTAGRLTFRVRSDSGTPTDPLDDLPLNGADYALTDADGVLVAAGKSGVNPQDPTMQGFVLHPAIPAGTYRLDVTAFGCEAHTEPVTIVAANLTDLGTITLAATGGVVTGTVFTSLEPLGGGDPVVLTVEGATVRSGDISDVTDGAGGYQLAGLPLGDHPIAVEKDGYEPASALGTTWVPGTVPVQSDVTLVPRFADVTGVVRDGSGALVAGAQVQAFAGDVLIAETETGSAAPDLGIFRLTLPTAFYQLRVALGASSITTSLDFVAGEPPATLTLEDTTLP